MELTLFTPALPGDLDVFPRLLTPDIYPGLGQDTWLEPVPSDAASEELGGEPISGGPPGLRHSTGRGVCVGNAHRGAAFCGQPGHHAGRSSTCASYDGTRQTTEASAVYRAEHSGDDGGRGSNGGHGRGSGSRSSGRPVQRYGCDG